MSLNSNIVYSTSLKRMLGYKLFPQINPEHILVNQPLQKNPDKLVPFMYEKKDQNKMAKMKKQIVETQKKYDAIQKQINTIVNKMVDQGLANVTDQKIKRHASKKHLRIFTQPNQKLLKEKSKSTIKLPQVDGSNLSKNLYKNRIKTQMSEKIQQKSYQPVNTDKYLKHYREGMTSIKKIKIKPLN